MTRSEIDSFFTALPLNTVYGLCDHSLLEHFDLTMETYVALCRKENVSMIQYRTKQSDLNSVAKHLERLRSLWNGILIINDHWQLCGLCDGVHVGQDDLAALDGDIHRAAALLRKEVGSHSIVGVSTHNLAEVETANMLPIDYIGLGAYRMTDTKSDAKVLGADLDTIASVSLHPVAAIGGVGFEDHFEYARIRVMGSALMRKAEAWT